MNASLLRSLNIIAWKNGRNCRPFPFGTNKAFLLHTTSFLRKLVQFKLSDIGEGIAEVQLKEWHVKIGDKVGEFDELCSVQSDKASVTITSRYSGVVRRMHFQPDEIAKVGQTLIDIEVAEKEEEAEKEAEKEDSFEEISSVESGELSSQNTTTTQKASGKILASPAVRRLIRERGISLERIEGTGMNGRILKEDIFRLTEGRPKAEEKENVVEERIVPLRGYTRAMFKTMTEALEIPHFGYGDEVFVEELDRARVMLRGAAEQKSVKLSYMPFFIKAASMALADFPILNSSLDQQKENIIFKRAHNISVAIDTKDGLVVPNVKNCECKSIRQIATDLGELVQRGRAKSLSREDLAGGTFALSNIGVIGGIVMSPVILPPQVAIGAIGKARRIAVFEEDGEECGGAPKNRRAVNVCWAADHRVIDGATLARFSNRFKQLVENPALMLVELR